MGRWILVGMLPKGVCLAAAAMTAAALGCRSQQADQKDQQGGEDDAEGDEGLPVGHEGRGSGKAEGPSDLEHDERGKVGEAAHERKLAGRPFPRACLPRHDGGGWQALQRVDVKHEQ